MMTNNKNEVPIMRYLLGELSEDQQSWLEEQFFADDELYREVQVAERELIDRYVQGRLAAPQRKRFESHFMALPARRRKVELARSFYDYVNGASEVSRSREPVSWRQTLLGRFGFLSPSMRTVPTAVMLLFFIICSLLVFETVRLHHLLARIEACLRTHEIAIDRRPMEEDGYRPPQPRIELGQGQAQGAQEGDDQRPQEVVTGRRTHASRSTKRHAKPAFDTSEDMKTAGVTNIDSTAPAFEVVSPAATSVLEDQPILRWDQYRGATGYRTFLNGVRMPASGVTENTQWRLTFPLRRGEAYTWHVAALRNGRTIAVSRRAKFSVVSQSMTDEIELIRNSRLHSKMELATTYLRAGLLDDFEREISSLSGLSP